MSCISYTNNHTKFTENIPVPLQRLRMSEYCYANDLSVSYDHLELYTLDYMPILQHIIEESRNLDIIIFSIFSLPEDSTSRATIWRLIEENKITLHFSNESLVAKKSCDIYAIEEVLSYTV